ncbi:MAG: maleylpyruvate isomerase N-terminal domain-containing protein [Sporichthyaceae bacterium]
MDATELLGQTRDALAGATESAAELIASIPDPMALAPNSPWTVRDFAAHLVLAGSVHTDMAQGVPAPYQSTEPSYLHAEFTRRNADIVETDPGKLSRLFVDAMEGFLDATSDIPGDTPVVMHGQNPYTVAGIAGVLLGEALLHGYDIATAIGRPWPLDPAATELVLAAYAPVFGFVLDPETTRGLSAGFGIELRGSGT